MSDAGGGTPGGTPTRPLRGRATRGERSGAGAIPRPRSDADRTPRSDALASLGALAGDLAHEVRNPLVAVASFLELLRERGGDPDAFGPFLEVARDELRRAERLLDAMVELRRGGTRRAAPGDVGEAIGAVAALVGPRARRRGVRIDSEAAPGLPAVALGSDPLRQVLLNLAMNAVDASPAGAAVAIAARAADRGVEIRVVDAGPGLRASGERAGRRPGGLGLAITRRLLATAGGALATRPAPGGGTLAQAWVPAAKRAR